MQINIAVVGPGGDASLSFTDKAIRVRWKEASLKERRMIGAIIKRARKRHMQVCTVDADGRPDKPAYGKDIPSLFRGGAGGELLIQEGDSGAVAAIAAELIEDEIKVGALVMEAQKDGTWKIVKSGDFKPEEPKPESEKALVPAGEKAESKPEEKRELQVSRPVGGG